MKFKTSWLAASGLLALATSFAHADCDMRSLENRVAALECRKSGCGMINPPARPVVNDCAALTAFGDLLIWQANANGYPLAVYNPDGHQFTDSKIANLDFDYDLGFRVGLDLDMPHDGWDVSLTWLRFYTDAKSKVSSGNYIFQSQGHPGFTTDGFGSAHGKWKGKLNQLDLDLGREFFVSKWVTLRPHVGLRSTWLRQFFNTDYDFVSVPERETHSKNKWWGLGVEGGLDTQWGLCYGFSFYGDIAAAIEYGFHKIRVTNTSASTTFLNVKESYRVSHPVLDLQLGLRWDQSFACDSFNIGIRAGWEHHTYFSQNQLPYFVDDIAEGLLVSNQGDLSYQGWTVGAHFSF